jgi:Domain of unknown function (DUF6531)
MTTCASLAARLSLILFCSAADADIPLDGPLPCLTQECVRVTGSRIIREPGVGQCKSRECIENTIAELQRRERSWAAGTTARSNDGQTGDNSSTSGCSAGNPIQIASGNKVETEVDFETAGPKPLSLVRMYNRNSSAHGMFGPRWLTPHDRRLVTWVDPTTSPINAIDLIRGDGSALRFEPDPAAPASGRYFHKPAGRPVVVSSRYVERLSSGAAGWRFHMPDGSYEDYALKGSLLKDVSPDGTAWTYHYSGIDDLLDYRRPNSTLTRVEHSSGRKISFTWELIGGTWLVTQETDPSDRVVRYTTTSGFLSRVTYAPTPRSAGDSAIWGSDLVDYHSENGLSGKSLNGQRYSYFSAGRTEHAGGVESFKVERIPSGDIVTVTNPYGRKTIYSFDGAAEPYEIESEGNATCPHELTRFSRSLDGTEETTTFGDGQKRFIRRTLEGQTLEEHWNAGTPASYKVTYEYDARRLLRVMKTPGYQVDFEHDIRGRQT